MLEYSKANKSSPVPLQHPGGHQKEQDEELPSTAGLSPGWARECKDMDTLE